MHIGLKYRIQMHVWFFLLDFVVPLMIIFSLEPSLDSVLCLSLMKYNKKNLNWLTPILMAIQTVVFVQNISLATPDFLYAESLLNCFIWQAHVRIGFKTSTSLLNNYHAVALPAKIPFTFDQKPDGRWRSFLIHSLFLDWASYSSTCWSQAAFDGFHKLYKFVDKTKMISGG